MVVYYDWMSECWTKEFDSGKEKVLVDMTPENSDECKQEFDTEEEFWDWYNSV